MFRQPPLSFMANVLKAQNIIANASARDNSIQQEHQFLGMIIGHLDYLFQRITSNKTQRQFQKVEIFENSQPITTQKKQNEETKPISVQTNQKDTKMMDQIQDQDEEDKSEVPSIEQVSNFDQEIDEKSSSLSYKMKKVVKQQKKKNKISKSYKSAKKPVSSFFFYYKERLKRLQQQKQKNNQSISTGNLPKVISKQWRQLSKKQKSPYVIRAEQSIKTYYSEKEKIKNKVLVRQKKYQISNNQEEKMEDNNEKEPLTSFFIYCKENYQRISRQYGYHQRGKLAKIASEQWKQLSNVQKMKYERLSVKNKSKKDGKDQQKVATEHTTKRRKNKSEQQEYKPKLYRSKPSIILEKPIKYMSQEEENDEVSKQLKEIKQVDIMQQKIVTQKDAKIQEKRSTKQQYPQPIQSFQSQDREMEKFQQYPNYLVIQVDSDDQLSRIYSQKLEENNDESYIKKIEKNKGRKIKGPNSPFLLYYQKIVNKLRMSNNTHGSQLVRLASAKWAELSENEKALYQSLAKKSREKYNEDVAQLGKGESKWKKESEE